MRPHALIVGGTGMLRPVAVHLARNNYTVSVIARNRERLIDLVKETQRDPGVISIIALDYADDALLQTKLEEAVSILGPISLAVSWIHNSAPRAPFTVATVLNRQMGICRLFDLLGAAGADLSRIAADREERFKAFEHLRYRRIILGHMLKDGQTRWLTAREISDGVIAAVDADAAHTIIGTLE